MVDGPSLVFGRAETCDVWLDMENVSRRHCEIRPGPSGLHVIEDLRSTNGTFVNGEEVTTPRELRSGDLVKIGGAIFKYLDGDSLESQFHEEIYRMTIIDGLTQAFNKRYLLEFLEREMARHSRYGGELSLMMLDVDHFKRVNDTFGHIAGDHVLREIGSLVRARVRREECFARYGGEEFALVMPGAPPEKVRSFAERIRAEVEAHVITFENRTLKVTISAGIARIAPDDADPAAFIQAADARLYEAKREGRNRVIG
jgi:diguanylate cyclase (GGDEF)-like protein